MKKKTVKEVVDNVVDKVTSEIGSQIMSLKDIANGIQKTIDLNWSNLEDKDGTPLGFQFPKEVVEKLDEARFLCLLTDAYLTTFGEFFEGNMSIQAFVEKLDKAKSALK